jgi:succinate dehydrogenase / fumarate reductase flavoprotein subunit
MATEPAACLRRRWRHIHTAPATKPATSAPERVGTWTATSAAWPYIDGTNSVDNFHRELGRIMWDYCGMTRNRSGLEKALSEIPALREEFWKDVLGGPALNQSLEKPARVADLFELGE